MNKPRDHRKVAYKQSILMLNCLITHLNLRISSLILFNSNLEEEGQVQVVCTFKITDRLKIVPYSEKRQCQGLDKGRYPESLESFSKTGAISINVLHLTNCWLQVQRLCVLVGHFLLCKIWQQL
jgi:hypothetical protein